MEEVDKIIIHSLKDIGCDIDDEVASLQQFTAEVVIEAATRCLNIITDGKAELPAITSSTLPTNMSVRFRIGSNIAKACTDLGYAGEMGYQTFLYPTECELRKIFIFLLERLPKETDKGSTQPDDGLPSLREMISESVRAKLAAPWVKSRSVGINLPFVTLPLETGISLPGQKRQCTPQEWRDYCVKKLPFVHRQLSVRELLVPSLIAENSRGLAVSQLPTTGAATSSVTSPTSPSHCWGASQLSTSNSSHQLSTSIVPEKMSWFALQQKYQRKTDGVVHLKKLKNESINKSEEEKLGDETVVDQETEEQKKEQEKAELESLRVKIEELQAVTKTVVSKLEQVEKETLKAVDVVKSQQTEEEIRQKTLSLLPDSNTNIAKLQSMIDSSVQRLKMLSEQWEKHRMPLISKYRDSRQRVANKASESVRQQETARELQEKLKELSEQVSAKEAVQARLQGDIDRLPKDIVTRPAYTRRIMEIIGNIKKQCDVINNVVLDTKKLQKDINIDTGRLERSYTVTDELIFKDAKRDETARKAYKMLAGLHSDCGELVEMVEETGTILREIRDLEEQIEVEIAKNTAANLERITADLQQMRRETTSMTKLPQMKLPL